MTSEEIERGTSTPVYAQLAAIIRRRILSGDLAPRYPVPSKTTLKQQFGVSDITVSKAMRILRQEGYAETVRGLGVFVTEREKWPPPD
jgi:GntR family transcriptional regulator